MQAAPIVVVPARPRVAFPIASTSGPVVRLIAAPVMAVMVAVVDEDAGTRVIVVPVPAERIVTAVVAAVIGIAVAVGTVIAAISPADAYAAVPIRSVVVTGSEAERARGKCKRKTHTHWI